MTKVKILVERYGRSSFTATARDEVGDICRTTSNSREVAVNKTRSKIADFLEGSFTVEVADMNPGEE